MEGLSRYNPLGKVCPVCTSRRLLYGFSHAARGRHKGAKLKDKPRGGTVNKEP